MSNNKIPREHKELCLRCNTLEEFAKEYTKAYGTSIPNPVKLLNRINGMWYSRERFANEIQALKSNDRIVMIPAKIRNKCPQPSRSDTLPDVAEILVKCEHLLAEMVQLQKEQIALFRKLSETKEGSR